MLLSLWNGSAEDSEERERGMLPIRIQQRRVFPADLESTPPRTSPTVPQLIDLNAGAVVVPGRDPPSKDPESSSVPRCNGAIVH